LGITNFAREHGVGVIVMATHGRGGMTRALLGSVATATLRQTDVPIMLVRPVEAEHGLDLSQPAAQPAGASTPPPATKAPMPLVTFSLSPDELTLLTRIVGERFYNEPANSRTAEQIRHLLEKLRTAPATSTPSAATR
jgi:hypothetical protein